MRILGRSARRISDLARHAGPRARRGALLGGGRRGLHGRRAPARHGEGPNSASPAPRPHRRQLRRDDAAQRGARRVCARPRPAPALLGAPQLGDVRRVRRSAPTPARHHVRRARRGRRLGLRPGDTHDAHGLGEDTGAGPRPTRAGARPRVHAQPGAVLRRPLDERRARCAHRPCSRALPRRARLDHKSCSAHRAAVLLSQRRSSLRSTLGSTHKYDPPSPPTTRVDACRSRWSR